jgi:hypothetical protein
MPPCHSWSTVSRAEAMFHNGLRCTIDFTLMHRASDPFEEGVELRREFYREIHPSGGCRACDAAADGEVQHLQKLASLAFVATICPLR